MAKLQSKMGGSAHLRGQNGWNLPTFCCFLPETVTKRLINSRRGNWQQTKCRKSPQGTHNVPTMARQATKCQFTEPRQNSCQFKQLVSKFGIVQRSIDQNRRLQGKTMARTGRTGKNAGQNRPKCTTAPENGRNLPNFCQFWPASVASYLI